MGSMVRLLPALAVALTVLCAAAAPASAAILTDSEARAVCGPPVEGEACGPGNGRRTPGGGEKVSHRGWPAITGILWMVRASHDASQTGSGESDELLGHHGSDTISGGAAADVIWGDWDPKNNNSTQRDVLRGGDGNDKIYPSHGVTRVFAGRGNDFVHAYYGRGLLDCGPGFDTVRVRWMRKAFRLKSCERVRHFCAFGTRPDGGCYKPGEKPRR